VKFLVGGAVPFSALPNGEIAQIYYCRLTEPYISGSSSSQSTC
jgi:hypothetical protein